jgi:hypothetical protein
MLTNIQGAAILLRRWRMGFNFRKENDEGDPS